MKKKLIIFIVVLALLCQGVFFIRMAKTGRVNHHNAVSISLSELLEADRESTKSVSLMAYENDFVTVSKNDFFEIADNAELYESDKKELDFDGVYIMVEKNDGSSTFAYVTENGKADRYGLMMSRLPCAMYELDKISDAKKLVALAKKKC